MDGVCTWVVCGHGWCVHMGGDVHTYVVYASFSNTLECSVHKIVF